MNKFHNLVVVIPYAHKSAARKQSDCTDSRNNDHNDYQSIYFHNLEGVVYLHGYEDHCPQGDQLVDVEENTIVRLTGTTQPETKNQR